jgi:glycerophosphoryl diester phosphodiesterase
MAAFSQAVHHFGADALETDVHLSRDGEFVVIHDPTVDRTTDGTGRVGDLPWRDLSELDAGHAFVDLSGAHGFRGMGVRLPRLDALLDAFPNVRLNVDAKDRGAMGPLVEHLHARGVEHRVLLASEFDETRASRFGYRGPISATRSQIRAFYLTHRLPWGGGWTPRTDALQIPYIWEGRQVTTPRLIREAHRRNLPVHVWTVDDPAIMRVLLEWGADGVQTDRPDLLARVLHEETGRPLPPGLLPGGAPVAPHAPTAVPPTTHAESPGAAQPTMAAQPTTSAQPTVAAQPTTSPQSLAPLGP